MASRTKRLSLLVAAAILASQMPSMGQAAPTHAEGRTEHQAPRAAVAPAIDAGAGRGWIGAGPFGPLLLAD